MIEININNSIINIATAPSCKPEVMHVQVLSGQEVIRQFEDNSVLLEKNVPKDQW